MRLPGYQGLQKEATLSEHAKQLQVLRTVDQASCKPLELKANFGKVAEPSGKRD